MFEEIGKWLLDIAKYIITAYFLANILGDMHSTFAMVGAVVVVAILFATGVYFIYKGKNANDKKQEKGKK